MRSLTRWFTPSRRRLLAAVLAAVTVAGCLQLVLNRPSPQDAPVVVALRELRVGEQIDAQDVEVRMIPPRAHPARALVDPALVHGRHLATPVGPGQILTESLLRTTGLLAGLPPETVALFVPLADRAVAAAATPGDLVDVHSPVDGRVVAPDTVVLRSSGASGESPGVWLAVTPTMAQDLAAARAADPLGTALQVTLRAPPG